jgi:hypothetical protein
VVARSFYKQQGCGSYATIWSKTAGLSIRYPYAVYQRRYKYDKIDMTQLVRIWSDEGITHSNPIFDRVKEDHAGKTQFERHWLETRHKAHLEDGATPKKCKCQPSAQARSELFESEGDGNIAPIADEAPLWKSLKVRVIEK